MIIGYDFIGELENAPLILDRPSGDKVVMAIAAWTDKNALWSKDVQMKTRDRSRE